MNKFLFLFSVLFTFSSVTSWAEATSFKNLAEEVAMEELSLDFPNAGMVCSADGAKLMASEGRHLFHVTINCPNEREKIFRVTIIESQENWFTAQSTRIR